MCRIAAYAGPAIPLENIIICPRHSLLEQSQHATEAKLAVNGDGFGIAWYGEGGDPGLYRDVLPAWADENLTSLCRMVRSRLFLSHVRASTVGGTSRQNCHPFKHGRWTFMHNGQVPHFPQIRRALEQALPDELYAARQGTTDSEMVFLTLLAHGLDTDPEAAMTRTLAALGAGPAPVKLTCVFSNGHDVFAFRHASHGKAPTLYVSGPLDNGGRAFASEPLDGGAWDVVPENQIVTLGKPAVSQAA
ncbi:class II glutamine amidotransferase [Pseudooctadecabacter jejudonensis]|uniref:Amidohydrolase EgtC n=1 Tax=Pseudooctadecabacter jejudonensis TaxID=1391910 RepID=A0A1Y5T140_9RHOB|nr:class II glutamine amidotransferase [Pseudooctadecabacter jejudonensis]SLN53542.1 Amidohydrolase EgtC [Pseudooctadecabacter jejudonensis]